MYINYNLIPPEMTRGPGVSSDVAQNIESDSVFRISGHRAGGYANRLLPAVFLSLSAIARVIE